MPLKKQVGIFTKMLLPLLERLNTMNGEAFTKKGDGDA